MVRVLIKPQKPGTSLLEMRAVLGGLDSVGCRYWLEGGSGIDALVGHQTRWHRDVDVDFDAQQEGLVLGALGDLGYQIETDWRPEPAGTGLPWPWVGGSASVGRGGGR